MSWAKRNLYFLISCVVAVGLLGAAGWYCFSAWQSNSKNWDELNADIGELTQLGNQKDDKVDNVKTAREQAKDARDRADALRQFFVPVPSIPNTNHVDDRGLGAAVRDFVTQMHAAAARNNVTVPADFAFSFSLQHAKAVYTPTALDQLAKQLGEVKVICDTLFSNRVTSLESVQREHTSDDASAVQAADYLDSISVTNNNTIITPYQVTFVCFSTELAGVLASFANQPHGIVVKTLTVQPNDLGAADTGMAAPMGGPGGGGPGGQTMLPKSGGLPVVVDEKKLKVTMLLNFVKILAGQGR